MMRRDRQGGLKKWWVARRRLFIRAVCDTKDVFHVHNCAKSFVDQAMFCHVAVQFLSLVRDNL